jgi:predicted RNA methylase
MRKTEKYIPTLSFAWLTPLYDPILKWGLREQTFKRRLIQQANIQPGMRVLDLGCGTPTLSILTKQTYPNAEVVGLDGDPAVSVIDRFQLLAPLYTLTPLFQTCPAIRKLAAPTPRNSSTNPPLSSPRSACSGTVVATAIGTMKVTIRRSQGG